VSGAPTDPAVAVGGRLRELRTARGLSLSALARAAGLGKATLSELEAGLRNPTLSTLFALTKALDLPLSAALPPVEPDPPDLSGDAVDAWVVERLGRTEVHRLHLRAGARQLSAPHAPGVTEQVLLVSGRALIGPEQVELRPGDALAYDGAQPHLWQALDGADAVAVLVMRYPEVG
jgi:transcriptional regulator with XRE-family HTH domain